MHNDSTLLCPEEKGSNNLVQKKNYWRDLFKSNTINKCLDLDKRKEEEKPLIAPLQKNDNNLNWRLFREKKPEDNRRIVYLRYFSMKKSSNYYSIHPWIWTDCDSSYDVGRNILAWVYHDEFIETFTKKFTSEQLKMILETKI